MSNRGKPKVTATQAIDRLTNAAFTALFGRTELARVLSGDKPGRDVDAECGYVVEPTVQQYREMFEREGIANRVVCLYPDECWSIYPELYETEDDRKTRFERWWDDFAFEHDPWGLLHRADINQGIGHFQGTLIATDAGPLDQPHPNIDENGEIRKKYKENFTNVLFQRTFSEDLITILETEGDRKSPRFGLPTMYGFRMIDPNDDISESSTFVGEPKYSEMKVHWHHVVHTADGTLSDRVRGRPRLRPVYNRIQDIKKKLGSSGEGYYKAGFPGTVFEAMPGVLEGDFVLDKASLQKEMKAFQDGLQRFMHLVGMTAKQLTPNIQDPTNFLAADYEYIAATNKVPLKVLMGSEIGYVAGQDETVRWNRRVAGRNKMFLDPYMIRPYVRRLMMLGAAPWVDRFVSSWKDLNALSDKDKADIALKRAQTILQYVTSGAYVLIGPRRFYIDVLQMTEEEADAILDSAGGEQKVIAQLKLLVDVNAGNSPNTSGTNPEASTGANGRTNGLGRNARSRTRSRTGGTGR